LTIAFDPLVTAISSTVANTKAQAAATIQQIRATYSAALQSIT
jgi:hypothetical protein